MAKYLNVLNSLTSEYPMLGKSNLLIQKHFYSESSRGYNTFLIKSGYPGFQQFVAKGTVSPKYPLVNEWHILKLLNSLKFTCPRLLIPEHEPKQFMLLEYINGENASRKLLNKNGVDSLFEQMGELTGKSHTVKAPWFGTLTHNKNVDWGEYLRNNTQERFNGTKKLISPFLYKKTKKFLESFYDLIVEEGQLPPMLIHRDIYSDNFIVENKTQKMFLIDFGMAIGGRPFHDLGKFYIFELYRFPKYTENFLHGYTKYIELPKDFNRKLEFYLLRELLGCINFFCAIKKTNYLELNIKILEELVNKNGLITKLIQESGDY